MIFHLSEIVSVTLFLQNCLPVDIEILYAPSLPGGGLNKQDGVCVMHRSIVMRIIKTQYY